MSGRAEPRELASAREELSWRERRSAIRAVNRGARVSDVVCAPLAVALARDALRRDRSVSGSRVLAAALTSVVSFTTLAVVAAHGGLGVATVVVGVLALSSIPRLFRAPGRPRRWARAEALNRKLLADCGRPFSEDESRIARRRPPISQILWIAAIQWVVADIAYGSIDRATRGGSLGLDSIVRHGTLFATIMTAFALVQLVFPGWRWWQKGERPAGPPGDSA